MLYFLCVSSVTSSVPEMFLVDKMMIHKRLIVLRGAESMLRIQKDTRKRFNRSIVKLEYSTCRQLHI